MNQATDFELRASPDKVVGHSVLLALRDELFGGEVDGLAREPDLAAGDGPV
jgi:hypothetical protein